MGDMNLRLIVLVSVLILLEITVNGSPQFTRCKAMSGHAGLCVADRFCRVRSIKLVPCVTDDPFLYCCPFPANDTVWSLEDKDSPPIIFPNEASLSGKPIDNDDAREEGYESDEIVFPQDETTTTKTTHRPTRKLLPFPFLGHTTSLPNLDKQPQNSRTQEPKRMPTSRERNPNENVYIDGELEEGGQILFELFPKPKTTTQRQRITTLKNQVPTKLTVTSRPEVSTSSRQDYPTTKSTVQLPETTTKLTPDKITYGPFDSIDTNKASIEPACGQAPFSPLIAGGTESKSKQWPWMAAIFQRFTTARPNKFLCGGSLISTRYILTAAHCCVSGPSSVALPASSFLVRMGTNVVHEGDTFSIAKVKVHSNFSFTGQFNDIALLRLTADLPSYTDRIAPVCLPYPTLLDADLVDQEATVVGWGASYLGGEHQEMLHEVTVPIVSTDDCALAYSRIRSAAFLARGSTHVLCAGLKEGGKDSCKSDSGGPLMIQLNNDRWTIIGIVSFGYRCAEPGFPGVYTSVPHYLEWIYSNTQD
ncbi:proclotting enzyme-like [Stegodyphus dumicola]|uniref:proclotting enzyme-like n=1 Tax=Stegodyphus dumicola TaxID=202533 RepID=UPI0015B366AB|nr:proclotting enzyme-like [Stegodyphus dumicola]